MSDATQTEIARFMAGLKKRNPGELEFHQAVQELAETVMPTVLANPAYREAQILERMTEPERAIIFRVCWEDDKGNARVNRGYRIQFNSAIGPYKGGLRFHPSVSLSILKFLGFEQIFKNALTGLPMGGGKGGANFNPRGKSDAEVRRFCHAFMIELHRHIGPDRDVPAGDIGVGAREIGFLFGRYKQLANAWNGTLTGKGLSYGGSLIRTEATGYGAVYFAREMLEANQDGLEGKTACVSGSGNVAQYATQKLTELGAKVVTLSDSSGFVHDPNGIDADKLAFVLELKNVRRGRLEEYAKHFGVAFHPGERPWGVKCDLAFPCATQNEVSVADAQSLIANGCRLVAEGANMPTELPALHAFQDAGVLFGPAKAVNAGGVATSGLEMSQNAGRIMWSREDVDARLLAIMRGIHQQCVEHGDRPDGKTDYVKGANVAGFRRVADTMLAYGLA